MTMPAESANANSHSDQQFSQHAATWWDEQGPLRTLHAINPARLDYIDRHCHLSGRQVLDLGCGGGVLSEAMARRGARVTGADVAAELIEVAREHARQQSLPVDYQTATSEALLAAGEARFDIVVCLEMLEHVDNPGAVIRDCARLLKPGGDLVLSTLNRTPAAYLLAIIGAEYITGLLPRGTHDYNYFIQPAELAACCRQNDLEVLDICGLTYLPWLNKAKLSRSTGVNYLLHARRND